jgi:NADH-quinone oxidoreductase subunit C
MTSRLHTLADAIRQRFGDSVRFPPANAGELTIEVAPNDLLSIAAALRDEGPFCFETMIDLCGVDYLTFGRAEWDTEQASNEGFSRAASAAMEAGTGATDQPLRFAVVVHLLSVSRNQRLRLRSYCESGAMLRMPSLTSIWPAADWYEREAFDLFGIHFEGHPDLRRLLTDYGFIGHPFRKDFPVSGNVEVRYDAEKGRVVYQPVSIEPRVLVPKIIRDDNRYQGELKDRPGRG